MNWQKQYVLKPLGWRFRVLYLLWFGRMLASGVLLTLGLVLLIQQVIIVSYEPSDFCQEYIAGQRVAQRSLIYQPLRDSPDFRLCPPSLRYDAHPPPTALLGYPFSFLPYHLASLLWGFLALAAFLASGFLLLHALGWRSLAGFALFVTGSCYWQPVIGAEGAQNLWQFLFLLIVLAWFFGQRKQPGLAGSLLGVAGLLKVWPAVLLLSGLLRQKRRVLLAGGVTLLLGTVVAWAILGTDTYAAYLGPVQASEQPLVSTVGNISLVGAVARLFVGDPPLLVPLFPGVSLQAATLLGEGIAGVVLLGGGILMTWYRRRAPGEITELLCQGLLLTMTLLVFPLIWYFGLLILLLPGTTTILALRQLPRPPRWWFFLLAFSVVPLLAPYSLFNLAGWLLEHHVAGSVWMGTALFAWPTLGLLSFASAQGYLLRQTSLWFGGK